jgi:hypothetical protein
MFIFFAIVLFLVMVIASSKKKQSKFPVQRASPTRLKPTSNTPVVNREALNLAAKHFAGEWIQFLAARNLQPTITIETIRERIAIGYSKMGAKPLEQLLISYVHVSTELSAVNAFGVVHTNNFDALHQAVYELLKKDRFGTQEIQTMLSILAETAKVNNQNQEAARKAKQAELKSRQAELKRKVIEEQNLAKQKQAELRTKIAEQQNLARFKQAAMNNEKAEQQTQLQPIQHELDQYLTSFESKNNLSQQDDSIIDISALTTRINLPDIELEVYKPGSVTSYPEYDPDQYSLGKKYKKKLNLSPDEVKWLNKFWNHSNVFNSIEGCELEIIKLFLLAIKLLNKRLKKENTTFDLEIAPLKVMTAEFEKSQPYYWQGYDEVYTGASAESEAYNFVYKKAESVIRDQWKHKRKISATFYSRSVEVKELFDTRLGQMIEEIIQQLAPTIGQPDENTEIALNEATTTRWRTEFQELTEGYQGTDHTAIVAAIHKLGKANRKNPAVEHIYYEASKFMTAFDRVEALKLYLHYIWKDLNSVVIDNKQLNKTIQKKLFNNEEQLNAFQGIIDELITGRNLTASLKAVETIYKAKRKNIVLDTAAIKRVEAQHSGTVDKLNEYLQDEEEVYQLHTAPVELVAQAHVSTGSGQLSAVECAVALDPVQLECLQLFSHSDYTVSLTDIEAFAKEKLLFKNQLIDGINERCYELLDDVLIEESEEGYDINPDYYKQILA